MPPGDSRKGNTVKITYGTGYGEERYVAPVLLPDIRRYQGDLQFRYISDELENLKSDGKLFLTDLLAQPSYTRDMVGLALTGQTIDPQSMKHTMASEPMSSSVMSHRVKVRVSKSNPNPPDTIAYKRAVVQEPVTRFAGPKLGVSTDGEKYMQRIVKNTNKYVDMMATEAEMPILDAWVCLSQHGRHCRAAKSTRLQSRYWLYEEADHPMYQDKPKRGRPQRVDIA
jgi:hypothetical protein